MQLQAKKQQFNALIFDKTCINSFLAHFEPHKLFVEMYNSYAILTLCKTSQKFHTLIIDKT